MYILTYYLSEIEAQTKTYYLSEIEAQTNIPILKRSSVFHNKYKT